MKTSKVAMLISVIAFVGMIGLIGCSSASGGGGGGGDDPVSITALTAAISEANALNDSVAAGSGAGNAPSADKDAYVLAIAAAQAVAENTAVTQAEVTAAIATLGTATAAFKLTILPAYLYKADGTSDIVATIENWGSGTTLVNNYTSDTAYGNCVYLTSGTNWGAVSCAAFTLMNSGKPAEFTTVSFKIKTADYTSVVVKVPPTEVRYNLSAGTALADGWVQMTVPMSDFASGATSATELGFFEFGAGNILLTDVCLSGTAAVNKTALTAAIAAANTLKNGTTVGDANGNISQTDKDTFTSAIAAAQAAAAGTIYVQSGVTEILAELLEAQAAFTAAIIVLQPTSLPAAPTLAEADVISLLNSSDTYTNIPVGNWNPPWSQAGSLIDATIATKNIKLLQLENYQGVNLVSADGATANGVLSISGKNHLHISYWTLDATSLSVFPINADTEYEIPAGALTATGEWADLDITINQAGFDLTTMRQLKFVGSGNFYLDNVYFY